MVIKGNEGKRGVATATLLSDAEASARDALVVGRQMMEMLREYTALEAQHAVRVQALARRMGDCVDRMRLATQPNNQCEGQHHKGDQEEEGDPNQCVAVMDEVVTFLTRFGSMHRQLSECLASDLFVEWEDALATQQTRMDAQGPEVEESQQQLEVAEKAYRAAHDTFREGFAIACTAYESVPDIEAVDEEQIEREVEGELASLMTTDQRRVRSPSKAMQYVGSISRLLRQSDSGRRRRSITQSGCEQESGVKDVVHAIATAESQRQHCQQAFQLMHRLHVRHVRLCDSMYQEYKCVQSDCLASTKSSIRKLVIHVSAFTSNLQYDATQLFQRVEEHHVNDLRLERGQLLLSSFTSPLEVALKLAYPSPPLDKRLALEHVVHRHFPMVNERPRLLRHQNARHVLSV